ncbi:hypothetical protein TRIP_B200589 [uncultured Desulfatiglans sp.]|nr:hypothetical protein TRIP_B200589 [uncultured Desulfatiglans sp.]
MIFLLKSSQDLDDSPLNGVRKPSSFAMAPLRQTESVLNDTIMKEEVNGRDSAWHRVGVGSL